MSSAATSPRDSARKTMVGEPVGFFGSWVMRSAAEAGRLGPFALMICSEREDGSREYVLPGEVSSKMYGGGPPGWSSASALSADVMPADAKPRPPRRQGVRPQMGPEARMKSPGLHPDGQIALLAREGEPGASDSRKSPVITLNERPSMSSAGSDRKSTRLNSSHLVISYAVFCLKKKNTSL